MSNTSIKDPSKIAYPNEWNRSNSADKVIMNYSEQDTRPIAKAFVKCEPMRLYGLPKWSQTENRELG